MGRIRREDGGERRERLKKFDDSARINPKVFDRKVRGRSFTIKYMTHVVTTEQAFRADG